MVQISWGKTLLLVGGEMDPVSDRTEGILVFVGMKGCSVDFSTDMIQSMVGVNQDFLLK